jgi:3-deoxy-manno-octulosonate cytidylyltransferase (CMP-KDO synthetase)
MIEQQNTIIVIPAHLASSRLPGKPMADINGLPMVNHVWQRAVEAKAAVRKSGGDAIVTPKIMRSGADRVMAALDLRDPGHEFDYVVCLDSNLPMIDALSLQRCLAGLTNDSVDIATIAASVPRNHPGAVKAIVPLDGGREVAYARDFMKIPGLDQAPPFWQLIGVTAFRRKALEKFAALSDSPQAVARGIFLLRALEHGMKIAVVRVDDPALAVNTRADLESVRGLLKAQS